MGKPLATANAAFTSLYDGLGENEIRFIILRPSLSFDDPIHLSLHTTDFDNRPVYKALSYVWGSPGDTLTVSVNGTNFEATKNLVSALRHIRQEQLAVVLWVDAICINQKETVERNHQVQMMSRIYEQAEEVIAWIGETYEDSDEVMSLLNRWGTAFDDVGIRVYGDFEANEHLFHEMAYPRSFIGNINDPFRERAWNAIPHFLDRPYWNRLWVFQEFVLPKKVVVTCGSSKLDVDFVNVIAHFRTWGGNPHITRAMEPHELGTMRRIISSIEGSWAVAMDLTKWRHRIHKYGKLSAVSERSKQTYPMFKLLWDASFRRCADPRDHLFAISGFCNENDCPIVVNYNLTEDETFIDFARSCLLQSILEVLCSAGIGYDDDDDDDDDDETENSNHRFPSWVACEKGSGRYNVTWPYPLYYNAYSAGKAPGYDRIAPACGSSPSKIILQGLVYDDVVESIDGDEGWHHPGDVRWQDVVFKKDQPATYVDGTPLLQVYCHMLLGDKEPSSLWRLETLRLNQERDEEIQEPLYGGLLINFMLYYCIQWEEGCGDVEKEKQMAELRSEMNVPSLGMGNIFDDAEKPSPGRWREWMENASRYRNVFVNGVDNSSYGKSFFKTSKGYMGTGPPYVKAGDKVCIIAGANVPFLLRKDGEGYLLVGEAFVAGLMDGECDGPFGDIELH